jgi:RNA polymerase sigma factor (sigma-70 family)
MRVSRKLTHSNAIRFDSSAGIMVSMSRELDRWFAREILPYEAALMRCLRRICNSSADIVGLRQRVYARVYESAARALPQYPSALLFAIARDLFLEEIRRGGSISHDTLDLQSLNFFEEDLRPKRRLTTRQELKRLAEAIDCLPDELRVILWLRYIAGLSPRQTAQSLDIEESALEVHMIEALRRLARAILSDSMCDKHEAPSSRNQLQSD